MFRDETWAETIKKVRETDAKMKLGEDPIFRIRGEDIPVIDIRRIDIHQTQTVRLDCIINKQQNISRRSWSVDMRRKLDEAEARGKTYIESQKKLYEKISPKLESRDLVVKGVKGKNQIADPLRKLTSMSTITVWKAKIGIGAG